VAVEVDQDLLAVRVVQEVVVRVVAQMFLVLMELQIPAAVAAGVETMLILAHQAALVSLSSKSHLRTMPHSHLV
jgi:hypothetical protein